jgi:plasmid maintenance system antidote protein VapI
MDAERNISDQLRKAIIESGISPASLWRQSGVAEAVISRFINGVRTITLDTAAKLAAVLGLELRPVKKRSAKGTVKHGKSD